LASPPPSLELPVGVAGVVVVVGAACVVWITGTGIGVMGVVVAVGIAMTI